MAHNRSNEDMGEIQMKMIQDRVSVVEEHFANICSSTASYARRTAMLRDKGDELAKVITDYALAENIHKSLRSCLGSFAECLMAIEDHRQTAIDHYEVKVTGQLSNYEATCKSAKDNIKKTIKAKRLLADKQSQLQRTRDKTPLNRKEVAETELKKATVDATQATKQLDVYVDLFEQKKLKDLKQILQDFVTTELQFHAKALELYTKAFACINTISEEDDMQELRNLLKTSTLPRENRFDLIRHIVEQSTTSVPTTPVKEVASSSLQLSSSLIQRLQACEIQKNNATADSSSSDDEDTADTEDDNDIEIIDSGHIIHVGKQLMQENYHFLPHGSGSSTSQQE